LKESLSTNKLKDNTSRLVPWVNGVKWSETKGLENLNLRTRGLGFDGVAMARPPNQNPKKRRLI
jgi:hypothetical protein